VLNKLSKLVSDAHVHAGLLPNDRDGTSAMAFCLPSICSGVSGHACIVLSWSARAWTRCSATTNQRDASRVTQLTAGELSLNSVTLFSWRVGHTPSRTNHSISSPTISRLEFVIPPVGFADVIRFCLKSAGHSQWKTTGVDWVSSPKTTPPTPWQDASTIPM
jgi:hypothetical protein